MYNKTDKNCQSEVVLRCGFTIRFSVRFPDESTPAVQVSRRVKCSHSLIFHSILILFFFLYLFYHSHDSILIRLSHGNGIDATRLSTFDFCVHTIQFFVERNNLMENRIVWSYLYTEFKIRAHFFSGNFSKFQSCISENFNISFPEEKYTSFQRLIINAGKIRYM